MSGSKKKAKAQSQLMEKGGRRSSARGSKKTLQKRLMKESAGIFLNGLVFRNPVAIGALGLFPVVGADMFLTLEHWYQSGELFRLARMCAAPRDENGRGELLAYAERIESLGAKTHVEELSLLPVSSTLVRGRIARGLPIAGLVPKAVEAYITAHHLYGGISNG